jgi:hypothetical protein
MGKASLSIHVDSLDGIVAGSCVKGSVQVHVTEAIRGSGLTLTFRGMESTRVQYQESRDGQSFTQDAHDYRTLVECAIPIDASWSTLFQPPTVNTNNKSDTILPGHYQLPFTLELPEWLPSSMHYSAMRATCDIDYELKTILEGSGRLWNYHAKLKVPVRARSSSSNVNTTLEKKSSYAAPPFAQSIRKCGCLGGTRGTIHGTAYVSPTSVDKGGVVNVSVACRNRSRTVVDAIVVTLHEHVRASALGRTQWFPSRTRLSYVYQRCNTILEWHGPCTIAAFGPYAFDSR